MEQCQREQASCPGGAVSCSQVCASQEPGALAGCRQQQQAPESAAGSGEQQRHVCVTLTVPPLPPPATDEIDAIAPKRETAQREMERRIVAQVGGGGGVVAGRCWAVACCRAARMVGPSTPTRCCCRHHTHAPSPTPLPLLSQMLTCMDDLSSVYSQSQQPGSDGGDGGGANGAAGAAGAADGEADMARLLEGKHVVVIGATNRWVGWGARCCSCVTACRCHAVLFTIDDVAGQSVGRLLRRLAGICGRLCCSPFPPKRLLLSAGLPHFPGHPSPCPSISLVHSLLLAGPTPCALRRALSSPSFP